MADAGTQQGTQGQGGNPAQNNPQGDQQQQAQEPEWLPHVPEQYRERAKKEWMLQTDYTKKTQELSEKEKTWETRQKEYDDYKSKFNAYEQWWNQNKPTFEAVQKNWDKIFPILTGQVANQNQNGNQSQDYFENYEVLPPQEQAKRMADYLRTQVIEQQFNDFQSRFAQALAQKEQQYNNSMTIFMEAMNRARQDPTVDINDLIRKVGDLSSGKVNWFDLAQNSLTEPQKLEKMKEEWMRAGGEQERLKAQNEQQSQGAFQNPAIPNFRTTPKTKDQIRDAVRQLAIKNGFGWGT